MFDGMELDVPVKHIMQAVYRSGVLLAMFPTRNQAKKYLTENSSIRMVEEYGFKFRVVPVVVEVDMYNLPY